MFKYIIREIEKAIQKHRLLNFFKKYKKVYFVTIEDDDDRREIYVSSPTDFGTVREFREFVLMIANDCPDLESNRLPYVTPESNLVFGFLFSRKFRRSLNVTILPGPKAVSMFMNNKCYRNCMPSCLFGLSLRDKITSFLLRLRAKLILHFNRYFLFS